MRKLYVVFAFLGLMLLAGCSKEDEPVQQEVKYGCHYPAYNYLVKSDNEGREVIYENIITGVIVLPSEGGEFKFSYSPDAIFFPGDHSPKPKFDMAVGCCCELLNESNKVPRPVTMILSNNHMKFIEAGKIVNLCNPDSSTLRIESPFSTYVPDIENNSFKLILKPNTLPRERQFVYIFKECYMWSQLVVIQEAAE